MKDEKPYYAQIGSTKKWIQYYGRHNFVNFSQVSIKYSENSHPIVTLKGENSDFYLILTEDYSFVSENGVLDKFSHINHRGYWKKKQSI